MNRIRAQGPSARAVPVGHDARMQDRQRTVIVIASGLALAVVAVTVNRLLGDNDGGWFAYAPDTAATSVPRSDGWIWREAAVWLGAIAAWSGLSLWLYRRHPSA
jgi:hypothetical protein